MFLNDTYETTDDEKAIATHILATSPAPPTAMCGEPCCTSKE